MQQINIKQAMLILIAFKYNNGKCHFDLAALQRNMKFKKYIY